MNKYEIYAKLTLSEKNDCKNLLESTRYHKNGLKLVSILYKIDSVKVDFDVTYGFHGSLFDKSNTFTKCIIRLASIDDKDKVENVLSTFKKYIKYSFKENNLAISLIEE